MGKQLLGKTEKEARAKRERDKARRRERYAEQRAAAARELELEKVARAYAGELELPEEPGKVSKSGRRGGKNQLQAARDAVVAAFERLGGEDGLVKFGQMYPKEFYTQIWAKMIPRVNEVEIGESLEDVLAQLGGGQIPGMLEGQKRLPSAENVFDAEFEEVDDGEG